MELIINLMQDGFFAALAAIGFTSISNPPQRAYPVCAGIAAVGHATRYLLIHLLQLHLILAGALAAFIIGLLAVYAAPHNKFPAETCIFPALLPMIPGMYAYRTIEALLMCLYHGDEAPFIHYFYLLSYNGFTSLFIILGMVVGATIPIFLFKKISFQATR
ncbi:MAG: threonine/serine exporter family protein [Bacteroides sp.]